MSLIQASSTFYPNSTQGCCWVGFLGQPSATEKAGNACPVFEPLQETACGHIFGERVVRLCIDCTNAGYCALCSLFQKGFPSSPEVKPEIQAQEDLHWRFVEIDRNLIYFFQKWNWKINRACWSGERIDRVAKKYSHALEKVGSRWEKELASLPKERDYDGVMQRWEETKRQMSEKIENLRNPLAARK